MIENNRMSLHTFPAKIQVDVDTSEIWNWTSNHFEVGTWGKLIGIHGETATYCFKYETDALLFILRFPDS